VNITQTDIPVAVQVLSSKDFEISRLTIQSIDHDLCLVHRNWSWEYTTITTRVAISTLCIGTYCTTWNSNRLDKHQSMTAIIRSCVSSHIHCRARLLFRCC